MLSRTFPTIVIAGLLGGLTATAVADQDDDEGTEAEAALATRLDDLIEVAVRLSPDLARAKQNRSVAQGQAGAARRDQAWVMRAGANYKKQAIGGDVEVEPFQEVATTSIDGTIGAGRKLPTGGTFELELGFGRTAHELNIPDVLGIDPTMPAGEGLPEKYSLIQASGRATFTQPVARGFGSDVALAEEHKADLAFGAATIQAQIDAETMVRDIVSSYWELAYASYELDTRIEAVKLAEAQEKLTREELRAGATSANAMSAVKYEIASREAAKLRAQVALEHKSLDLRRKAGLEIDRRNVVLRPGEPFEVGPPVRLEMDDVLARTRKANRHLVAIDLQKKMANIDVSVAKNAMLPQVDLSLSGALIGTGETTDQAFGGATSGDGFEVMAGVSVSFDISGAAKAQHNAAIAQSRKLDIDRADIERQLEAEVVNAVKGVTSARRIVELAKQAIDHAEDNLKADRLGFQAGKVNNYSVMERQTQLIDARLSLGRAISDYHIAVAQLQFLTGTLLQAYRINVRPKASGGKPRGGGTQ
ncbi:MAG: TolC family protein [Kofleriaceae bacterium]